MQEFRTFTSHLECSATGLKYPLPPAGRPIDCRGPLDYATLEDGQ
jgi:hypothetical protein